MAADRVPLLLAVETALHRASLALFADGRVLAERRAAAGRATAEALLPELDALLGEAGVALADVGGFAVSVGPGSFTGLRIGVATVKGLAFGTGRRVVAVPTLEVLARQASGAGPVAAVLDARRGELYAAGFAGGAPAQWLPEQVVSTAVLASALPRGCRVVGEGLAVCGELLRASRGDLELVPDPPGTPAAQVAALGAGAWRRGEAQEAEALVPRYLLRAQAEVVRTGERFEAP